MISRLNPLFGRGQHQGFTLIELLIVILIVGILAAVAAPIYLGYVKDAKTAEGKAVAGSLWTAVQSNGIGACGNAVNVTSGYAKAGLGTTGATNPARWQASDLGTLSVDCTTGVYTVTSPLFRIAGTGTDVNFISIGLFYDATASPPAVLRCNTAGSLAGATDPVC